jgi:hypothetical protein
MNLFFTTPWPGPILGSIPKGISMKNKYKNANFTCGTSSAQEVN